MPNMRQWPGQFIGLSANVSFSMSSLNMFSESAQTSSARQTEGQGGDPQCSQWPDVCHSFALNMFGEMTSE